MSLALRSAVDDRPERSQSVPITTQSRPNLACSGSYRQLARTLLTKLIVWRREQSARLVCPPPRLRASELERTSPRLRAALGAAAAAAAALCRAVRQREAQSGRPPSDIQIPPPLPPPRPPAAAEAAAAEKAAAAAAAAEAAAAEAATAEAAEAAAAVAEAAAAEAAEAEAAEAEAAAAEAAAAEAAAEVAEAEAAAAMVERPSAPISAKVERSSAGSLAGSLAWEAAAASVESSGGGGGYMGVVGAPRRPSSAGPSTSPVPGRSSLTNPSTSPVPGRSSLTNPSTSPVGSPPPWRPSSPAPTAAKLGSSPNLATAGGLRPSSAGHATRTLASPPGQPPHKGSTGRSHPPPPPPSAALRRTPMPSDAAIRQRPHIPQRRQ